MGRKIPGKKHRGVKDPEKQQLIRLKSVQHKVNAPPSNPDNQDVPKSLEHFIKLKKKFKENPKRKRKHRSNQISGLIATDPKLRKKEKLYKSRDSAPAFNQKVGESTGAFMFRVNQTVSEVLRESKFEDKYKVKIQRNLKTGEVSNVVKQKADPLTSFVKEAQDKEKAKSKPKKNKKVSEPKLTKSQKKKKKLDEKKAQKELQKAYDFNIYTDKVEFGDIVHAPPTLVTPKKVNKLDGAARPGTKDLLLKSFLDPNSKTNNKPGVSNKKSVFQKIQGTGKIDKKGKRKDLPHAIRRQLETTRNEIVNAYRSLKAKKSLNNV